MTSLIELVHRVRSLFLRRKREAELEQEFQFHLEMEAEQNRRLGMGGAEARHAAWRDFGGVARAKDESRDQRGFPRLEELLRDLRIAARTLRRSPGPRGRSSRWALASGAPPPSSASSKRCCCARCRSPAQPASWCQRAPIARAGIGGSWRTRTSRPGRRRGSSKAWRSIRNRSSTCRAAPSPSARRRSASPPGSSRGSAPAL